MCGIVAKAGDTPAAKFVFDGLKRLEYRGYDSWGSAVAEGGKVICVRQLGAPSERCDALPDIWSTATVAIAHTRWATHGEPSVKNCHPIEGGRPWLRDEHKCFVVHNGVIENHIELKFGLQAGGWNYKTDTDTETIAHLLSSFLYDLGYGWGQMRVLIEGVSRTVKRLKGQYAFVGLHTGQSDQGIFGVANGAPLCFTDDGHVASDPIAFVGHAKKYTRLPDGHVGVVWQIEDGTPYVFFCDISGDSPGKEYCPKFELDVPDEAREQGRGLYRYHMMNEIMSQPGVMCSKRERFGDFPMMKPEHLVLIGCGSSYNACVLAREFFEMWTEIPTTVEYASEFSSTRLCLYPDSYTFFVAVTQSGETKDTLEAMKAILESGEDPQSLGVITNQKSSEAVRLAGWRCLLNAGQENGVAATKTFLATVAALMELAAYWSRKPLPNSLVRRAFAEGNVCGHLEEVLGPDSHVQAREIADIIRLRFKNILFLGCGVDYAVAREGALKLKEVSYVHAEAMPAAEMKHGPIALIDDQTACVFLVGGDSGRSRILANIQEVKARGGYVIAISDDGEGLDNVDSKIILTPSGVVQPMMFTVVLQLIAYYTAVAFGHNPDRPRSLAKCVTV